MLGDCVVQDCQWRSYLGMGLANRKKRPVLDARHLSGVLTGNWQLGSIQRRKADNHFDGTMDVFQIYECKKGAMQKIPSLNSLGERSRK